MNITNDQSISHFNKTMRGSTLAAIMIIILTGVFAWSWTVMGKYPQEDIDRRKTKDEKDK
ncbi:hypothetical protein ACG3JJ_03895 [Streptococcus parauberis]|uniref:Uncharacterized protein n=1 Tax=Streptococcus parauberis TaxID=1348 RepID=A0AAE4L3J7_9STRE|nr:hypothetical protein [Streptococcus parauberis]MDT2731518.1 hypothetical protein [Streptococcus parauberis]MDT2749406.1 hypothetical protein [Streptococcus parauberis]UWM88592.1 hypothetical protein N2A96_08480 [Streptococcus parauberis]UWM90322.1 hypothetical protein N2A94_07410 [Streptococcus parauberis]UWV10130.1 hypothetical protein N2A95_10305 [Streptococcus parauberis]